MTTRRAVRNLNVFSETQNVCRKRSIGHMTAVDHVPQSTTAVSLAELTAICEEGRGKQLASHEPPIPIQLNRLGTVRKK